MKASNYSIRISDTTEALSITSGALQVAGGAGIKGNAYVGGDISVGSIGQRIGTTYYDIGDVIVGARWRISNGNSRLNFLQNDGSGNYIQRSYLDTITGAFTGPVAATTVLISSTLDSVSTTSGALQVVGGISTKNSISVAKSLRLFGDTSGDVALKAPSTVTSYSLTLPEALPITSGYALVSDLEGKLSFAPAAGGGGSGSSSITFSGANNVTVPAPVTDFKITEPSFLYYVTVSVVSSTVANSTTSMYDIRGTMQPTGEYDFYVIEYAPVNQGVSFSITSSGQVMYTSPNVTGWVSTTMKIEKPGSGGGGGSGGDEFTVGEIDLSSTKTVPGNIAYPSKPLIANDIGISGATYGNGQYSVSSSSVNSTQFSPFNSFSDDLLTRWISASTYNSTTGAYTGAVSTTISNVVTTGEWLQLRLPYAIVLSSFTINPSAYAVDLFKTASLAGSNDGSTWTLLTALNVASWVNNTAQTFAVAGSVAYSIFRLVCKTTQIGADAVILPQMTFYETVGMGADAKNPYLQVKGNMSIKDTEQISSLTLGNTSLNSETTVVTGGGTGRVYPPTSIASNQMVTGQTYGNGAYLFKSSGTSGGGTLITVPPGLMTADATNFPSGTFVVSASSTYGVEDTAWKAFDGDPNTAFNSVSGGYSATSPYNYIGTYSTGVSGTTYSGEWLQLRLPFEMNVSQMTIRGNNDPTNWILAGSHDGSSWFYLYGSTTTIPPNIALHSFAAQSVTYLRLIVRQGGGGTYIGIRELSFTGQASFYPPAPMTSNTSTLTDGTYVASASSVWSTGAYPAWEAFDKISNTDYRWLSSENSYSGGIPVASVTSTTVSGTIYKGDWVQLQLPSAITAKSSTLMSNSSDFIIAGSNDGTTWTYLASVTPVSNVTRTVQHTTIATFRYYRVISTRSGSTAATLYDFVVNATLDSTPQAFDGLSTTFWNPSSTTYTFSTGAHTGTTTTTVSGTSRKGEWLQLSVPYPIVLDALNLTALNPSVYNYVLAGSNDETTWTLLIDGSSAALTWTGSVTQKTLPTPVAIRTQGTAQAFSIFRLIILTMTPSSSAILGINEFQLVESGTTVVTSTSGLSIGGSYLSPVTDAATSLGLTSKRFSAVYATNGTIQTSDERLKDEVATLPSQLGLQFIQNLQPVTYKMPSSGEYHSNAHHMGLSAQNVLHALEFTQLKDGFAGIERAPDGTLMMNYAQLIAPLCKAIQEMNENHDRERKEMQEAIRELSEQLHRIREER